MGLVAAPTASEYQSLAVTLCWEMSWWWPISTCPIPRSTQRSSPKDRPTRLRWEARPQSPGGSPAEQFRDPQTLMLPSGLPPGACNLSVGLYDPATGQRLPLLAANGQPLSNNAAALVQLNIQGNPH